MSDNRKKKVLVIGAGPAGLTAAYELLKRRGGMRSLFSRRVIVAAGSPKQ